MYKTCPKCQHVRLPSEQTDVDQCPSCGLIFSKWMKQRYHQEKSAIKQVDDHEVFFRRLLNTLLYVPESIGRSKLLGHALIFLVFFIWGWSFILMSMQSNEIGSSFMHNINLVFHEAGHVIFRPFGRFMTILGGSLLQLLVPVVVMVAFIWKNHDNFGASIGLWWLSQSMMDLAPYINDARAGQLMLLGGVTGTDMPGIHDWRNILTDLGLLRQDHTIARMTDMMGELFMLISFVWGAYILYLQYQTMKQ